MDEKLIKIAQVKIISGKKTIAGVYTKNIEGLPPENVWQEIKNGMVSLKTSARRVSVVLPSKLAITKNIEVPSLDEEEIGNIIKLQAVRHTPYSKEEVIVGHINLEKILDRYTKVLLVIVSDENIRKKTDAFELAGYQIEDVHLGADVLVKLINEYRPFTGSQSPQGIVSVEPDFTDFIIAHNGKPYYIRSIPVGLTHLNLDAPLMVSKLVEEFKKTYEAYQSEDQGSPIKRFLVCGTSASAGQASLLKSLQEEFRIETEAVSLEAKLPLTIEASRSLGEANFAACLDVFADGLAGDDLTVNLLPEELKLRKSFRQKGREMFSAAIFVIVILVLTVSVFLAKIYFRKQYLKEITSSFVSKQKEAADLDVISEQTRMVKDFRQKRKAAGRVLDEFQNILPVDMYLSEITLTKDEHVSIKGTSKLMSSVFSFVTQLENSPCFKTVVSDYTKSRKENEKEVSDFGLSAVLEDVSGDSHG